MGMAAEEMATLCEAPNRAEADELLAKLRAHGLSGSWMRPTAATRESHAGWELLVPRPMLDDAREVLREFRIGRIDATNLDACPACGYSMEGLPGHERCPECGANLGDLRARTTQVLTQVGTEFAAEYLAGLLKDGGIAAYCASGSVMTLYGAGAWNVYVRAADMAAARRLLEGSGPAGQRAVRSGTAPGAQRKAFTGVLVAAVLVTLGFVRSFFPFSSTFLLVLAGVAVAGFVTAFLVWGRRGAERAAERQTQTQGSDGNDATS